MALIRLPRFKRSPEIAPMRLTERDLEILKHVHRHRFLRSSHITTLVQGSRQQTLRRLRSLYHHGFLERPTCQIDYYHRTGSSPMVYGLGNKGAGLLKRHLALPFNRFDWPSKNRVQRFFLEHALMVSDFMVALEVACRKRPDLRLLAQTEQSPQDKSIAARTAFQWNVNLDKGLRCGVVPDRVFGLQLSDESRVWFCLEVDRATMPVMRRNLKQSSIHRKFLSYEATWTQNLHRTYFGWSRFRVLTITDNSERLTNMQTACRSLKHARGLFLFADAKWLAQHSDFFSLGWRTHRDDVTTRITG